MLGLLANVIGNHLSFSALFPLFSTYDIATTHYEPQKQSESCPNSQLGYWGFEKA